MYFRQQFGWCRMANIAETENSYHPFVLVDRRQPPDLQLLARFSSSRQQWITAVITSRTLPPRVSKLSCANPLQTTSRSSFRLSDRSRQSEWRLHRGFASILLAQSQIADLRARVWVHRPNVASAPNARLDYMRLWMLMPDRLDRKPAASRCPSGSAR
jgi:hypothetical protein